MNSSLRKAAKLEPPPLFDMAVSWPKSYHPNINLFAPIEESENGINFKILNKEVIKFNNHKNI